MEHTLAGRSAELKERLLGIEVFRRAPDYDTNTDPVVRVTAAEVRKRIAQYYQEPGHAHEIRIDVPTGSYVPHFSRPQTTGLMAAAEMPELPPRLPGGKEDTAAAERQSGPAEATAAAAPPEPRRHALYWPHLVFAVCVGALLTYAGVRIAAAIALLARKRSARILGAALRSAIRRCSSWLGRIPLERQGTHSGRRRAKRSTRLKMFSG